MLSTPKAKFFTMDIKNFYLNTHLETFQYLRMHIDDFPQEIINEYGLTGHMITDDFVYIQVEKGMPGLKEAGMLANKLLEQRLTPHGYYQSKLTPGLWRHKWRSTTFALVVDDFGVKYTNKADADHLIAAIKEHYEIAIDWEGQ